MFHFIFLILIFLYLGRSRADACKLCVDNLGKVQEDLMNLEAAFEVLPQDDKAQIAGMMARLKATNESASNHVDAAKSLRTKVKNLLEAIWTPCPAELAKLIYKATFQA